MTGSNQRWTERRARVATSVVALGLSLAAWGAPTTARAAFRGGDVGLGIILGEPSGITVKGFLHPHHAIAGYLSWDFTEPGFVGMVDYQAHLGPWVRSRVLELGMLVGVGGKVGVRSHSERRKHDDDNDLIAGIRVPIGLWLRFSQVPIELAFELAPGLRLAPATTADIDGGLAVRFYF